MTWIPHVPVDQQPIIDEMQERMRRLQFPGPVTLAGCTDAQLEAEVQRRQERREQQVKEAIKLVEGAGYTVVKAP